MKNHWAFWGFWISINAVASFIWGNIVISPSLPSVTGMLLGILFYIVVYSAIDGYLQHHHNHLQQALRKGVYIKAALQLLNLALFFELLIAPELWAGIASVSFTQEVLDLQQTTQPFLFSLTNTILTGALLSLMVVVISGFLACIGTMRGAGQTNGAN